MPIVWCVRTFVSALLTVASLLAQGSISRQMAAVERQQHATAGLGGALQRQQMAVARQKAAVERIRHEEPWNLAPSEFDIGGELSNVPACPSLPWNEARDRFEEEEKRNELPPGLLGAVALQESGLYPCAVSSAGATGLMQLMPATAMEFGVGDPFDPWQSLQGGGQFLRQLLNRYNGDLRLALGAYNAGPSRVDYFGGIPPFAETQNYVESVMSRMKSVTAVENPAKP
jgi:soluble lytic murein transglycosylase-like protein